MRLQVAIFRHQLPPVRLVFNTAKQHGPGAQPIVTVADFLFALSNFVPLESTSDGEWGFEDYVVEVAATSDQEFAYECLHYQDIGDVLHEDDEVVVRALSSADLRDRRLGGRLQISNDGRHLIDGLSWGSRWRGQRGRPDVEIPPRKRRRIMLDEEEEAVPQIAWLPQQEWDVHLNELEEDDDDDDDEEFVDELDASDESSEGSYDENMLDDRLQQEATELNLPLQIISTQTFDNADDDTDSNEIEGDIPGSHSELSEELQGLLEDVNEAQDSLSGSQSQRRTRSSSNSNYRQIEPTFQGFSSPEGTPLKSTGTVRSRHNAKRRKLSNGETIEQQDEDEDDTSSSSYDSSDTSDTTESRSPSMSIETSSADSDASASSSDNDSETSSSSSGSDSSELDELSISDVKESSQKEKSTHLLTSRAQATQQAQVSLNELDTVAKTSVPPGSGTVRTKRNNIRKKLGKQLKRLKSEGKLGMNADFDELRQYLQSHGEPDIEDTDEVDNHEFSGRAIDAKKQDILKRLENIAVDNSAPMQTELDTASEPQRIMNDGQNKSTQETPVSAFVTPQGEGVTISPQSQPRLDLASSRRMLFSSLGVRNPKTAAAEEALRERLSKPTRVVKARVDDGKTTDADISSQYSDAWKQKLTVSAVECVRKGISIPAPTFPFRHPWQVRKELESQSRSLPKNLASDHIQQQDNIHTKLEESFSQGPTTEHHNNSATARTPTAGLGEEQDLYLPEDISSLPPLKLGNIDEQSIIAYKELHMNSRFEPEESPFRTAKVIAVEGNIVHIQLSKRDRESSQAEYDEETGQRIYSKFEMPQEEEDAIDDGFRELSFGDMIDPRLVAPASSVQVAASDGHNSQVEILSNNTTSSQQEASAMIPESAPQILQPVLADSNRGSSTNGLHVSGTLVGVVDHPSLQAANNDLVEIPASVNDYSQQDGSLKILQDRSSGGSCNAFVEAPQNNIHEQDEESDHMASIQTSKMEAKASESNYNSISPLASDRNHDSARVDGDGDREPSLPSVKAAISSNSKTSSNRKASPKVNDQLLSTPSQNLRSRDRVRSSSPLAGSQLSQMAGNGEPMNGTDLPDAVKDVENPSPEDVKHNDQKKPVGNATSRAFKSSLTGLGSKRLLTGKKTRG